MCIRDLCIIITTNWEVHLHIWMVAHVGLNASSTYGASLPTLLARSAPPPSAHSTNKPNGLPPLSMLIIAGELSPSPPISPSPAPTRKTRLSTSKVNRMLDIYRTTSPLPPPVPAQETSVEHPVTEATTPQSTLTVQDGNMEQDTSQPTRPSNNHLPCFNQVREVANLQPQKATR